MRRLPVLLRLLCWSLLLVVGAAVTTVLPQPAVAAVDAFAFETDEQQRRFRQMSDDFRCPMCQNTSLTGSSGGVAEDLRREIYLMIMDGKTDYEIEQFMLERYGDFIFYRPRLTLETVLLWFGPLLFLVLGGWIIFGIIRRAQPLAQEQVALNDEEQQRLKALLDNVKRD